MDKKYAIFDMDGTLIDSMAYWKNLGREYLALQGITENVDEVIKKIKPMTMTESAELFRKEFNLSGTKEAIAAHMNQMMDVHYQNDIPLKDGIDHYLEILNQKGVKMCVASATDIELMTACLTRLGIKKYFSFLISCEEVGAGKNHPDIYFEAAKRLQENENINPGEIAVFEDAPYAISTAVEAGFYTIAVLDQNNKHKWEQLKAQSNEYIDDWRVEFNYD